METKLNIPRIENMESPRTGNPVANQFKIYTDNGVFFQSYSTIIAFKEYSTGKVYLDNDKYEYSRTTAKYRNAFLCMTTKEIEDYIADGRIELIDLNK